MHGNTQAVTVHSSIMNIFRLTVEKVNPSGTELPDTVSTLMTADGEESILGPLCEHLIKTCPHRIRLVKIERTERHETVLFRRSTSDTPFVT